MYAVPHRAMLEKISEYRYTVISFSYSFGKPSAILGSEGMSLDAVLESVKACH